MLLNTWIFIQFFFMFTSVIEWEDAKIFINVLPPLSVRPLLQRLIDTMVRRFFISYSAFAKCWSSISHPSITIIFNMLFYCRWSNIYTKLSTPIGLYEMSSSLIDLFLKRPSDNDFRCRDVLGVVFSVFLNDSFFILQV